MRRIALLAVLLALSVATAQADGGGGEYVVDSTAYDLRGTMASGNQVYDGAVACNFLPLGTLVLVLSGSYAGRTLTVEDRIGWGSDFDIWMASGAMQYGRQYISIRVVTDEPAVDLEPYRARTIGEIGRLVLEYGAKVRR